MALLLVLGSLAPATASPTGEEFIILRIEDDPLRTVDQTHAGGASAQTATQTATPSRQTGGSEPKASTIQTRAGGEGISQLVWTSTDDAPPAANGFKGTSPQPVNAAFGTKVRVTNLSNGRSVVVHINDRGPFKRHRVIDLAHGAASELRMMQAEKYLFSYKLSTD